MRRVRRNALLQMRQNICPPSGIQCHTASQRSQSSAMIRHIPQNHTTSLLPHTGKQRPPDGIQIPNAPLLNLFGKTNKAPGQSMRHAVPPQSKLQLIHMRESTPISSGLQNPACHPRAYPVNGQQCDAVCSVQIHRAFCALNTPWHLLFRVAPTSRVPHVVFDFKHLARGNRRGRKHQARCVLGQPPLGQNPHFTQHIHTCKTAHCVTITNGRLRLTGTEPDVNPTG